MEKDLGMELSGFGFNENARSVIIRFRTDVDSYQYPWNGNLQFKEDIIDSDSYSLFGLFHEISLTIAYNLNVIHYDNELEIKNNKISFVSNFSTVPLACNIISSVLTRKNIRSCVRQFCNDSKFLEYIDHDTELWELRDKFYNRLLGSKYNLIEICMLNANNTIINSRIVAKSHALSVLRLNDVIFRDFLIDDDCDLFVTRADDAKIRIIRPNFQGNSQWYGYFKEQPTFDKNINIPFDDFVDFRKEKISADISTDICNFKNYSGYYDNPKSNNFYFSIPTTTKPKRHEKPTQNTYGDNEFFWDLIENKKLCFNITSLLEGNFDIFLKTRKLDDESYALIRNKSQKIQYVNEISKVTEYSYEEQNGRVNYMMEDQMKMIKEHMVKIAMELKKNRLNGQK